MTGAQEARTRRAYDVAASSYAAQVPAHFATLTEDLAVLGRCAADLAAAGGGPVLDVGCGPGHVTAHLAALGVDCAGLDLSTGMVGQARAAHPGLSFAVGSAAAVPVASGALAGVLAWYSLIHVPPGDRPAVLRELRRVLRPGGLLLLGFQAASGGADEERHLTRAYGHDLDLVAWRLAVPLLRDELSRSGFRVARETVRPPGDGQRSPQAFVLAAAGPAAGDRTG